METHVKFGSLTYILMPDMLGRGETARVFPAYQQGTDPSQANWAIKLARDHRHNIYIEREYDTLIKLHGTNSLPALPIVKLGESLDGRKALIMQPLLKQSLLAVFEGIDDPISREKLALRAAQQYTNLIQALVDANISCRDRKLGDLWWVGEPDEGQLIVTDWNVVDNEANQFADIRRFGLLWFELVIGKQMLRDFQPKRKDFDRVQDKVSYGLWHIIGRAVGSGTRFQFDTVGELADALDILTDVYEQSPQTLINAAQTSLQEAQTEGDRSRADFAWVQLDIAERLGAGDQSSRIEQARLLALETLTRAIPDLLDKLASSHFSEASFHLQLLKDKAMGPQELGDIQRVEMGFDFLYTTMSAWVKADPSINLAEASREFAEIQSLLVEDVLYPLMEKNGPLATSGLQNIVESMRPHLDQESLDKLRSLEREASFWEAYQHALADLDERPEDAIEALGRAMRIRHQVSHWPAPYEPTLQDIEHLKEQAEANRRSVILAGETAKKVREQEVDAFQLALREDIAKRRWGEAVAELLAVWGQNPNSERIQATLDQVVAQLLEQRARLAEHPATPSRLDERAQMIDALLQFPPDLALEPAEARRLYQEMDEIHELQAQIALGQKQLFQDPAQVLDDALENGYELFDDAALSAVALKAVLAAGRWDDDRFSQEIDLLRQQAEHFQSMTQVLQDKRAEMEQEIAHFETWQKASPDRTKGFLLNALQLYLTSAEVQMRNGASAQHALERAGRLIDFIHTVGLLPPDEQELYQNLYEHLIQQESQEPLPGEPTQPSEPTITEAQLEEWFKEHKFKECHAHLDELADEDSRHTWETRIKHAVYLQELSQKGAPELDNGYFKRRQNVRLCAVALDAFRRGARESDLMAYELYQDRIQILYEETWKRLAELDEKIARRFNPHIRDLKTTKEVVSQETSAQENGKSTPDK